MPLNSAAANLSRAAKMVNYLQLLERQIHSKKVNLTMVQIEDNSKSCYIHRFLQIFGGANIQVKPICKF
jgi:hypothetical protein